MYKILGIDPGTNHLGLSIILVDEFLNIISIDAQTFHLNYFDKIIDFEFVCPDNRRFHKIQKQTKILTNIFNEHRPSVVCYEAPFINYQRPQAYGALMEVVFGIKYVLSQHNTSIPLIEYAPSYIKKNVGSNHIGGKKDMKQAVFSNTEIMSKLINPLDLYDEHSIDAIACGYIHVLILRGIL